jgi:FAD dependent oxidoreductase
VLIKPSHPISAHLIFTEISFLLRHNCQVKSGKAEGCGRPPRKRVRKEPPPEKQSFELHPRPNNKVYTCGEGDFRVPLFKTTAEVGVSRGYCQGIVRYAASVSEEIRCGDVTKIQACYLPILDIRPEEDSDSEDGDSGENSTEESSGEEEKREEEDDDDDVCGGPVTGELGILKGLAIAMAHTVWGIQNGSGTGKLAIEIVFEGKASAGIGELESKMFGI